MAQLVLSLLGPLQATLDGVPVAGFESQKMRALLAYLSLEADRPHARDALAGLLWPNQIDQDARNNLRQALANLRQALDDQRATPPYLRITRDTVQFNRASDHQIDVVVFSDHLTACDQHLHRHPETCRSCGQRLQQAAALYRGSFLDQFFLNDSAAFEEWVLLTREWLHHRALAALPSWRATTSGAGSIG
jgi:DNA-binding SARP family transcriptional activator